MQLKRPWIVFRRDNFQGNRLLSRCMQSEYFNFKNDADNDTPRAVSIFTLQRHKSCWFGHIFRWYDHLHLSFLLFFVTKLIHLTHTLALSSPFSKFVSVLRNKNAMLLWIICQEELTPPDNPINALHQRERINLNGKCQNFNDNPTFECWLEKTET